MINKNDKNQLLTYEAKPMNKTDLQNRLAKTLVCGAVAVSLGIFLPELALATSKFDIDAGIKAATNPLVKGLTDHWGKGVLLSGGAAALIGEGDPRQRAIRAGIGCGASGGVMLLLLAMLS